MLDSCLAVLRYVGRIGLFTIHNNTYANLLPWALSFKAELANSLGLGGAMVFSLNTDDYNASSLCSSSAFPLTTIIKLVLNNKFVFH